MNTAATAPVPTIDTTTIMLPIKQAFDGGNSDVKSVMTAVVVLLGSFLVIKLAQRLFGLFQ